MRVRVEVFDLPPYDDVLIVKLSTSGERKRSGVLFADEAFLSSSRLDESELPLDVEADVIEVVDDGGRLCCYIFPPRGDERSQ